MKGPLNFSEKYAKDDMNLVMETEEEYDERLEREEKERFQAERKKQLERIMKNEVNNTNGVRLKGTCTFDCGLNYRLRHVQAAVE